MKGEKDMTHGYAVYRKNRIESTIEFLGGFSQLSESEQKEYKRLKNYFVIFNALIECGLSEKEAEQSVELF